MRILVVGAGFAGATFARTVAESNLNCEIVVIDKRDHLAGNAYTFKDSSGIEIHKYGPHIFHTNSDEVWSFITQFGSFNDYRHKVFAEYEGKVFSLPVNLHTINQFFEESMTPVEAEMFLKAKAASDAEDCGIVTPANFEEKAISLIGIELYEAFFQEYTRKQWGRDPKELPAQILSRLPIRFNYDTTYFNNAKYQGIPEHGYTSIVKGMLDHPKIRVELRTPFSYGIYNEGNFNYIVWTGPIDAYFNYYFGRLDYRSCSWDEVRSMDLGTSVLNFSDPGKYTRAIDFKYFKPEKKYEDSVVWYERSQDTTPDSDPSYPIRDQQNLEIFKKYKEAADSIINATFVGRLANYQYYDMDQVIAAAQAKANLFIQRTRI